MLCCGSIEKKSAKKCKSIPLTQPDMSNNVYVYLQSKLTSPNMTKDTHISNTEGMNEQQKSTESYQVNTRATNIPL